MLLMTGNWMSEGWTRKNFWEADDDNTEEVAVKRDVARKHAVKCHL